MNILAIDFGTKNIGLAWADSALGVVLPFGLISNKESRANNKELADLIIKEKIDKVIIGLPLSLEKSGENENTKRVKKFAEELELKINVSIEFVDERFSSQQADRTLGGVSRDEKSAMVILEDYLQSSKK